LFSFLYLGLCFTPAVQTTPNLYTREGKATCKQKNGAATVYASEADCLAFWTSFQAPQVGGIYYSGGGASAERHNLGSISIISARRPNRRWLAGGGTARRLIRNFKFQISNFKNRNFKNRNRNFKFQKSTQ
jgi:hypothetical protein